MLAGLSLLASVSLYWLGNGFDVEPTHSDRMTDTLQHTHTHTTERGSCICVGVGRVCVELGYMYVYMGKLR